MPQNPYQAALDALKTYRRFTGSAADPMPPQVPDDRDITLEADPWPTLDTNRLPGSNTSFRVDIPDTRYPLDSNQLPGSNRSTYGGWTGNQSGRGGPLDANRLPEAGSPVYGGVGKNYLSGSDWVPLDANRYPEAGIMPYGSRGKNPMIQPEDPEHSASILRGNRGTNSIPYDLYNLQTARRDELQRRVDTGEMGDRGQNFLNTLNRDISDNPIAQDLEYTQALERADAVARTKGFSNVQEMAQYAQQLEMAKANSPQNVARINAQGDIEKQKIAGQTALDVANTKTAQAENFIESLYGLGGRVKGFGMPGGGSVSFDTSNPTVSAKIAGDVTRARATYEKAKADNSGWLSHATGRDVRALQAPRAALEQSIDNALSFLSQRGEEFDPQVLNYARKILLDDNAHNISLEQIMQGSPAAQALPPEIVQSLQRILSLVRGF